MMPHLRLRRPAPTELGIENDVLRALSGELEEQRRLLTIQWERRRQSLERALHDGAQQQLLGLRLTLSAMGESEEVAPRSTSQVGVARAELLAMLDEVVRELARLASGERPDHPAVVELTRVLSDVVGGGPMAVRLDAAEALDVDGEIAEALVFVVSELVTNAYRHSGCDTCEISVRACTEGVSVTVSDAGTGGASVEPGGGIEGLIRRVEAFGGTIEIASGRGGTRTVVVVPDRHDSTVDAAPPPRVVLDARAVARDRLAVDLGDPPLQLWVWCSAAGYRDEMGCRPPDAGGEHPRVRIDARDDPFVVIGSSAEPEELAACVTRRFDLILDARRRATAAVAHHRVELERSLVEQRRTATDLLVSDRLTRRSTEPLLAARRVLEAAEPEGFGAACREASAWIGDATNELRLLVRRIRDVTVDGGGTVPVSLAEVLRASARRARVHCTVTADELRDANCSAILERVAEELMFAAGRGARVRVSVRRRGPTAVLRTRLDGLPEPSTVTLVEHAVMGVGGRVSFRAVAGAVRVDVELPCAS